MRVHQEDVGLEKAVVVAVSDPTVADRVQMMRLLLDYYCSGVIDMGLVMLLLEQWHWAVGCLKYRDWEGVSWQYSY